jgi:hypothetical protein
MGTHFPVHSVHLFIISVLLAFNIFVRALDNQTSTNAGRGGWLMIWKDSYSHALVYTALTYWAHCDSQEPDKIRCFSCYHLPLKKYLTHLQSLLWIWYWELLQLARQATNKPTHMDPRTCNRVWLHKCCICKKFLTFCKASRSVWVPTQFLSVDTRNCLPRRGTRLTTQNYLRLRLKCIEFRPHFLIYIHHTVLKNRNKFRAWLIE